MNNTPKKRQASRMSTSSAVPSPEAQVGKMKELLRNMKEQLKVQKEEKKNIQAAHELAKKKSKELKRFKYGDLVNKKSVEGKRKARARKNKKRRELYKAARDAGFIVPSNDGVMDQVTVE